ncbi:CRISPR-associated protein Csm5 [Gammaproteobacteria bacterium]
MVNQFLKHYRLVISTLSPIHIGCGEDYEPTNYVMDDGLLYIFDPVAALSSDESARNELMEIVTKEYDDNIIEKIQNFFHKRTDTLLLVHSRRIPVGDGIQEYYNNRVGKTMQANTKAINRLNIERMSYVSSDDRSILPGTSLKGAIRTALLDDVYGGKPLDNKEDVKNRKNSWKTLSPIPRTLGDTLPQKFERDPMRLIRIGDANPKNGGECSEIFFAVNHKLSSAEGKGPYQTLECVSPMGLESFITNISFLDPEQVQSYDDDQPTKKKGLPPKHHQWDYLTVVRTCNNYYKAHLLRELREIREFLDPKWVETLQQSLDEGGLKKLLEGGKTFLLRAGRHSGAESMTLNGARYIYRPQRKDWVPKPSTVWIAAREIERRKDMLPFGWLLVEIDDGKRRPLVESAPELVGLAKNFLNDRTKHIIASDKKLVILREKSEAKRIAEEERQAKSAREAAEKAAREARLTAMTPNQRKIEGFRTQIAQSPIPQPISGKLWQDANKLVADAEKGEWMPDEKAELNRVCREELPGKLIKDTAKKQKELRVRLDKLMAG